MPLVRQEERPVTVLVVEDDDAVRNVVCAALQAHGYAYGEATDGTSAVASVASAAPDIMLLDLGLPDIDGCRVIEKVRTWSTVPIIVLSARAEDSDKIEALDAGADDYLTKPFSVGELMARLRTTERHLSYQQAGQAPETSIFVNGDLRIDYAAGTVDLAGEQVKLTPIEFRLLCLLARNAGRVLTHQRILSEVWGTPDDRDLASLRVFMGSLRKKIERGPHPTRFIQTHVGVGYQMLRV
jgi:two-component system KDP operon response regulator KdpE